MLTAVVASANRSAQKSPNCSRMIVEPHPVSTRPVRPIPQQPLPLRPRSQDRLEIRQLRRRRTTGRGGCPCDPSSRRGRRGQWSRGGGGSTSPRTGRPLAAGRGVERCRARWAYLLPSGEPSIDPGSPHGLIVGQEPADSDRSVGAVDHRSRRGAIRALTTASVVTAHDSPLGTHGPGEPRGVTGRAVDSKRRHRRSSQIARGALAGPPGRARRTSLSLA
jgi:hypothetical protein